MALRRRREDATNPDEGIGEGYMLKDERVREEELLEMREIVTRQRKLIEELKVLRLRKGEPWILPN